MNKKLVPISVLMLYISALATSANGHNPGYEIVAVYGSTPTIDGVVNQTEWNNSAIEQLDSYTTLYLKQDGLNLYIAITAIPDTTLPSDNIVIYLDVDNDGSTALQSDDIALIAYRNGTIKEAQGGIGDNWTFTAISGWTAQVHSISINWAVEFNITYTKIDVFPDLEKTVGAAFARIDDGNPPSTWPSTGFDDQNPSTWGDITPTGYNWIPEFCSTTILLTITITTILLSVIYKGKQRRHVKP